MTLIRNKTLRYALIAAAALVALVVALPFVVPVGVYRDRIESAAENATGRNLTIEGPLRLMLFPHLGLRAQQVTFANMPGGRAAAMANIGDIELSVRLLPLLTGHIALDEIVLDHPDIELEVDAQGQANWKFQKIAKANAGGSSVTLPIGTEFSGIKISDGRIVYDNAKTGTHRAIDHVNATVGITRLDHPVTVGGNFTIGEHKADFVARVVTLKSLLGNGTTALDLSVTSDMMQASFKGLLAPEGGLNGLFKLDTGSLRAMAAWLGETLPAGGGLGALSLTAQIDSKEKVTKLSPLRLSLDRQMMAGDLSVDNRGDVPVLDGTLTIDHLDLNPYLASGGGHGGGSAGTGWSREPISLALLKKIDGKLTLTTGALRLRGLHLGHTTLMLTLDRGALTARLDPINLYGGTGQAELAVNGEDIRNSLAFHNVALRPFLADTLGITSIEGVGALNLDVTSHGSSAYAVMHAINGRGAITAVQGRFRGIDMGRIARTIQTVLGAGSTGDVASTDFHDMGGSFVITQGVLASRDFHLAGPVLQAAGQGTIDIGNRTIDFRIVPKAAVAGASIGVPFRMRGSWDHVHYLPDLGGLVNGVMQNLESGRAPLKDLFGGGDKSQDQNNPKKKKKNIGDALKNMFGIH